MSVSEPSPLRARIGPPYRWLRRTWLRLRALTPLRQLRAMQLRRLDPLGGGRQRGEPVIRYYWRVFLDQHRQDVRGRALEIGSSETLTRYGNGAVQAAEVLDIAPRPGVSVVADLTRADDLASDTYDCFVVPFTAHLLFDVDAALYHAIRLLKPGGVLLINFPCVDYNFARGVDMGTGKPLFVFWWFTPLQVENLLRRAGLQAGDFEIAIYGNLFARVAYQMNMPAEELTASERGHADPGHPLLICVRVVKPAQWSVARPDYREAWVPDVTPAQWNRRTGHYPGP